MAIEQTRGDGCSDGMDYLKPYIARGTIASKARCLSLEDKPYCSLLIITCTLSSLPLLGSQWPAMKSITVLSFGREKT